MGVVLGVALAVVDLVQVARAVVQVVQRSLQVGLALQWGQLGLGAVAQRVVAVPQGVALAGGFVRSGFFGEVADLVVGEGAGVQGLEAAVGLHGQLLGAHELV